MLLPAQVFNNCRNAHSSSTTRGEHPISAAGALYEHVQRGLGGLKGHQHAPAVEFARFGKAIGAAQIAVVRDVQAHGFDGRIRAGGLGRFGRGGIEKALGFKLVDLAQYLIDQ